MKVKCICNEGFKHLTLDKVYEVYFCGKYLYGIVDDNNEAWTYPINKFKKVEDHN